MHFFYCVGQYDMLPHPQWQTSKYWNVSKSERDFYFVKYLLFPWTVDFLIYIKVAFTVFSYLFDRNNWHTKLVKFCPKTSNAEFVLNPKGKICGLKYLFFNNSTYRRPIWKLSIVTNTLVHNLKIHLIFFLFLKQTFLSFLRKITLKCSNFQKYKKELQNKHDLNQTLRLKIHLPNYFA